MNKTKIEWTDRTWNPVTGCRHGCGYCYARSMARRFGRDEKTRRFEPQFKPERLSQPLRVRKPEKIFVCSVSDLMGRWVPAAWIKSVLHVVEMCPRHTFQCLTKNPERYNEFDWPENAWLGATTVDQSALDCAADAMDDLQAVTFISAEPLLGPVRLNGWRPNWVIVGAQTGPGRNQPDRRWVRDLTADARKANAAVFYKPNLVWDSPPREFPT